MRIKVGARSSRLSRAQVVEVHREILHFVPELIFEPIWIETTGDKDRRTSLRLLDKTNFFTKEVDELLLAGDCRIAIHSAKDLPDPLPRGLVLAALTQGVDPRDALVLPQGMTLETLPSKARIGTSSIRREKTLLSLRSDLVCVDIRGNIDERLALLDTGEIEGVVIAEAALIRLRYQQRHRILLPGQTAPLQGQLAVIVRSGDDEMQALFKCIDSRS